MPTDHKPAYQIARLVDDVPKPFFILETIVTRDGPRTRICNGRWETEEKARERLAAEAIVARLNT